MMSVPTSHGRTVPILAIGAGDVSVRALANQLAKLSLWNGATHFPYSPAQRGWLMAETFSGTLEALYALLHPAAMAFTGVIEPAFRRRLDRLGHREAADLLDHIEHRARAAIRMAVGIPVEPPGGVFEIELAHVERVLWATELRDLCAQDVNDAAMDGVFGPLPGPLSQPIKPWNWQQAEERWLRKFRQLAQAYGVDPDRSDRRDPSPFLHQEAIAP